MSAVRIGKIKLQNELIKPGTAILGNPAIHFRKNTIYLPAPRSGKLLRIDTENDRLLEPIEDSEWVSSLFVSQDRDFVFALSTDHKSIKTFRVGSADSTYSLETEVYPENAAFDSERDLLLVMGTESPPPGPSKLIDIYRFPESNHLGRVELPGNPVSLAYDDLEDEFVVLADNPSAIHILKPEGRGKIAVKETLDLPNSKPTCFEMCPSSRRIVVGTSVGRIISVSLDSGEKSEIASFRDEISGLVFNPLLDHLYVSFRESRFISILDMETSKIRETVKCASDISSIVFDEMHNKFYTFLEKNCTVEVYLEQGR